MAGKLQNEDFKTEAELTGAGGAKSQLLNDTKVYITANSINKTLDDAIIDGDLGGGGAAAETQTYRANNANGYGSSSTNIRQINTVIENLGSGLFTAANSATLGFTVTVIKDCTIALTYTDNFSGGSNLGLSLNSAQLSTGIQTITAADRLWQERTSSANFDGSSCVVKDFLAGDVIRPHTSAVAAGNNSRVSISVQAWIAGSGSASSDETMYLSDSKSAGTEGGTFTNGSFQTRVINTSAGNTTSLVSLSSNQFVLSAGTYRIFATAPGVQVRNHKLKLRNTTGASDLLIGMNTRTSGSSNEDTPAVLIGEFTVAASQTLELQHRCETTVATTGLGRASSFGVTEEYARMAITKIG